MALTSLSSGVRAALTSLNSTAAASQQGQLRLATGKKVNSAIDSPVNYFTASGLNDRAGQLTDLLDGISNGVQTITAASKGIDGINKLVKSLQSTIKQAQADAATNRPKVTSTIAFATNTESTATSSSLRDVALNKTLVGAGAAATASTAGDIGLTAAGVAGTSTDAIQIQAGDTKFKIDFDATTTVRDLVNSINDSGIATASVGSDGKLSVTGTGSDPLTVEVGVNTTATNSFAAETVSATSGIAKLFGTDGAATPAATDTTAIANTSNSAIRSTLVDQFNDLRDQIDSLASDSSFNGINLLAGDKLSITFNERTGNNKNQLDVQGSTVTSADLGISTAVDGTASTGQFNIQNDTDLEGVSDSLTNVLSTLRATSSSLGSQLSTVQTRQDFTKDLVNTLTQGADNLVSADTNEEGAKLLALQTRQQLSQTALTLSNQADQAVLRLF